MKKYLLTLAILLASSALAAQAQYQEGYYDKMDGKKCEALKAAAKECVESHERLVYKELPNYWQYTDIYKDLYQGQRRWWDMYSDNIYLIASGQTALTSFSYNKMQREHSVPKSWWKENGDVEYTPAYSDLWNLYPSDGPANQAKLNYPLGECASTSFNNGVTKVGPAKTGQGGGSGMVFEPADEYKGDFARSFFYMATVYDDLPWCVNYMFQKETWPTLRSWAMDLLLQWARKDPVSQKEIDRNNAVEYCQGNRNPFVDFPELAEYVWGTRTTETFVLADQGGNVTPPSTGDPVITQPVNGTALDFGEVAVGQSISAPLVIEGANLTGPLSLRITGTDRAMFQASETSVPAVAINSGGQYLLNIIYTPTAVGEHSASLMLYDGGLAIADNVAVSLIGHAFPVPTLQKLTALEATGLTPTSYVANWEKSTDVVDYYVVTRVRYPESGPESEELIANTNYLEITDRELGVAESYTVRASRLGYLSEDSNSIVVDANTGIVGVQASQPLSLGIVPGGFIVMLDEQQTGLTICDLSGSVVLTMDTVSGGERISLPRGIYMVTTAQSRRPLKILVTD